MTIGLGGGNNPVSSVEDILLVLPEFLKPENSSPELSSPVRDAILEAITAMMQEYQLQSEQAVAMNNLLRSLGAPLIGLGEDREFFKADSETDEAFRVRVLGIPAVVTPEAIVDAVNRILAPFTSVECQYSESILDRWYVNDGDAVWHSFVWDDTESDSPQYFDRLYEDDQVANLGFVRRNSNPGGARVYDGTLGRLFLIRLPDLSGLADIGGFMGSDDLSSRWYIGGGIGVHTNIRSITTTFQDTLDTIVGTINKIKGHSIRYILYVDPKLTE